jgi:hypothetical protein
MSQSFEQRSAPRSAVAIGARVRAGAIKDFVALVNLTPDGCCVMSKHPILSVSSRVLLQPEALSGLRAQVQWVNGCLAGLRFEHGLHDAVYEHIARTFWRPDDLAPTDFGEAQRYEISATLRANLMRKIVEAEAKTSMANSGESDYYRRLKTAGRRPPLKVSTSTEAPRQLWFS